MPFLFSEHHVSAQTAAESLRGRHRRKQVQSHHAGNYEFLRDSYFRYACLLGKEVVHTPGRTFGEGIAKLHEEMENLVGEELNVNIEEQNGRLLFRLWKTHRWGVLTLYYFPVKFLEALGPELRRISITFIHKLMKANGIQTVLDEDDTDYVLIWLSEEVPDETAEERRNHLKLLHSYENGRIQALLRRVENRCYYKNFPKALDRYEPQMTMSGRWSPP